MNMRSPAYALEKPGNEDFVSGKNRAADRANPVAISAEAVYAAAYMHEAVFASVQRGEGMGADQLANIQLCRADRAGLGFTGNTLSTGFSAASSQVETVSKSRDTYCKKKGIAEP